MKMQSVHQTAPVPSKDATVRESIPPNWKLAVQFAYGHLWHINTDFAAPIPMRSPGEAARAARKSLLDLLTKEERGEAINKVGKAIGRYDGGVTTPGQAPEAAADSDPLRKLANEVARVLPILARAEDSGLWSELTAGTGVATTNALVHALQGARVAIAIDRATGEAA